MDCRLIHPSGAQEEKVLCSCDAWMVFKQNVFKYTFTYYGGLCFAETSVARRNVQMNFDLVLQNIQQENILAGEGESFVRVTSRGAQLAQQHLLPLRLYSNGILMFNGPFRSYQEASTQQCMQDVMHGYFPSDLQDRFADGVPFRVCVCVSGTSSFGHRWVGSHYHKMLYPVFCPGSPSGLQYFILVTVTFGSC
uniref:UBX domain-containing protein 11 n=1 Tax=Oncorhynchus kisutch TaxID=8019 RepID=A0A8C7HRS9_ONCKI